MTLQARYSGVCPACGGRWAPGDFIRTPEGGDAWEHAVCPDAAVDDLTPTHPACPVCWLTHPAGACDR
jgi:hypothetical protein